MHRLTQFAEWHTRDGQPPDCALFVPFAIGTTIRAPLFVRTLMNLRRLDLGFDQEHVLALRLEPRGSNLKHQNEQHLMRLFGDLIARVQSCQACAP